MRAVTPKSRLISKPWLPPVSPSDHKVAQEAEKAQVQPSAISKIPGPLTFSEVASPTRRSSVC